MNIENFPVLQNLPIPPIKRDRKGWDGRNVKKLKEMGVGGCITEVPKIKVQSLRNSASANGMKLLVRKLESGRYMIMRTL